MNLPKLSARSLTSSSGSSVQELQELSELCQAYKRVSREDQTQKEKGESGLSFKPPLARQLSVKLDNLEVISRDHRLSVIVTPSRRTPSTSTPSNSPPPPPRPPRTCQSLLGPILPPAHTPHSPACSDLSSIDGDVFFQTDRSLSGHHPPPGTPRYCPQSPITGKMQEAEADPVVKQKMLYFRMRNVDPVDIDESTLAIVDEKLKAFDDNLTTFMEGIERLLLSQKDVLSTTESINGKLFSQVQRRTQSSIGRKLAVSRKNWNQVLTELLL